MTEKELRFKADDIVELLNLSEKTPLLAVGMNQTLSQPKADEYAQVL